MWVALAVALIWSCFCVYFWDKLGSWFKKHWIVGTIICCITLVLILVAMLVPALAEFPINWVIYIIFVLLFTYSWAFLSCVDMSRTLFYCLWSLFFVIGGFFLYLHLSPHYLPALESFFMAFGISFLVLLFFIAFVKGEVWWKFLGYLLVSVYSFYLGYSLRTSVFTGIYSMN